MGRKFLGTLIIIISIAILLHLAYLSPTIWEEAPLMWKHYQSDPDEFMMKDEMDTLFARIVDITQSNEQSISRLETDLKTVINDKLVALTEFKDEGIGMNYVTKSEFEALKKVDEINNSIGFK